MTEELAASLPRRVLAWMVDVGIVAALSAAVARTQAESFGPVDTLTNRQQDRLAEITSGRSISWTLGETTRIWAGDALWTTIAAIGLILLIVLALLPANVGGWTPGMRLAGLRVITVSGNRARLHHHVIRNVVGLLDMFPFVIPGLLGWLVAWRSPDKQRLGDRAAGTRVVDRRHPERPVDPGSHRSRWKQFAEEPVAETPAVFDELEVAAKNWAVLDADANLPPTVANTVARTVEKGRSPGPKSLDKVLPPLRRDQREAQAPAPAPRPRPEPRPMLEPNPTLEPEPRPEPKPTLEPEPRPEPRPILEPRPRSDVADTHQVDEGSLDPLPGEDEAPIDPTTDLFRRMALGATDPHDESVADEDFDHGKASEGPEERSGTRRTVWSDEYEAWMYLDTDSGRWLMHDPESNRWLPVE